MSPAKPLSRSVDVTGLAALLLLLQATSQKEIEERVVETIDPAFIRLDAGVGYQTALYGGRRGDSEGGSDCVLLEDGKPLGPARALHADIRSKGRGAYSHWTAGMLYFSAGDGGDPRTNGRTYTLVSTVRAVRRTTSVVAAAASSSHEVTAPGKAVHYRRLVLRNLDGRAAVIPLLRARGEPDFSSREGMLKSVLAPEMGPEAKSIAIWSFLVKWRYHYYPAREDAEIHDPVKFLNVYGYGFCDDAARNFAALCETAGLKARVWGLNGHVVAESFYDGAWHMFDPDHESYYRGPGGRILGVEELAKDPSPITATPTDPVGAPSADIAKLYSTASDNAVWAADPPAPPHRLEPVLQPGDELTFDLAPAKRVHRVYAPNEAPPPKAANGTLTRKLDLAGEARFQWPYVLVGGRMDGDVSISADGVEWTSTRDLSAWLSARKDAPYGFSLRGRGAATLTVTFQFAPRALPSVRPGTTTFDLILRPAAGAFPEKWKGVELTYEWDEPR